jgi:hypoxanthine phosphoribosyltransferase
MTSAVGSAPAAEWPDAVTDALARCTFPPAGSAVTVAVSGGPDSLALLVLAAAHGCVVTAVHVDHGLRPGSGADAGVVAEAARRFGASFVGERVELAAGPNLEARARAARYGVLPAGVATGHTMDDQAETVLSNLLRGAGLDGLAGMRPGPTHPLLGLRRADTEAVCAAVALVALRDPSNADRRHLRNRIRHELLPLCAELARRDPVPLLARQAELCGDEGALLDALAAARYDPTDARALSEAPVPLARRAVRQWLRAAEGTPASGGRPGPADRHPPSMAEVTRVLAVAGGEAVATEISGGRRVRRRGGRLVVGPAPSGKVTPVQTEEAERLAPPWAAPEVGVELVSARTLAARVHELGAAITADYAEEAPLLVGVLKGAMIFMSDLCRAIELPVDVDFMAVSSYGSATRTSGVVRIVKDLDAELTDRHVLVVEDIIDSGLTLNYLRKYLQARHPKSVEVCALLVKEGEQRVELDLRYIGFTIPSTFVVGYGLDVAERFRNLAGVHAYVGPPGGH